MVKRLVKLSSGHTSLELDRVLHDVSRYRISLFEFTGSSSVETIHVKINHDTTNYDETNEVFYTLFFVSYTNGTITYTPQTDNDCWFNLNGLSGHNIQVLIDGALAGDISSRNCYIEIEYT